MTLHEYPDPSYRHPGYPFLYELLADYYETTDELEKTFAGLNPTQRLLYAIGAFDGEVNNGGISKFFYDCRPILWDAARDVFKRLQMGDLLVAYDKFYRRRRAIKSLDWIRRKVWGWDKYRDYHAQYETSQELNEFDSSYYRKFKLTLDDKLRDHMIDREAEVARIVEEHPELEQDWFRRRLRNLLVKYELEEKYEKRQPHTQCFELLFDPVAGSRLGATTDERRKKGREICQQIYPVIREALNDLDRVAFHLNPSPHIEVSLMPSGEGENQVIRISYFEDTGYAPLWGISAWPT